ncbi:MAG: RfaE bifunctional protein [Microgenomates group bacterium GW2011_GWC2_45_8]|nr:MAG: RfaE bifunctional protein [Microgenomates group bacterium GW2011_GWC2_45_8]KKU26090.1 MAG: RfaE bifunctional protein [Microgenomates group bacterium GW2011_GWA2_46_16]
MFYTITPLAPICNDLRSKNYKLVLATGFFDLLHSEHINFLTKAKAAGDILIVAVESDERARITKGEGRPIETQSIRCQHLLDLEFPNGHLVDYVISLPLDFNNFAAYDSLISAIRPMIYAISSHTTHLKSKTFLVEKYGGKLVIVHEFNPEISTTKIIADNQV